MSTSDEIDEHLHNLDDEDGLISLAMHIGRLLQRRFTHDVVYRAYYGTSSQDQDDPDYPLIVVDEYQDFSAARDEFIELLGLESPVLDRGRRRPSPLHEPEYACPEFIRRTARAGTLREVRAALLLEVYEVIVAAVTTRSRRGEPRELADRLEKAFELLPPRQGGHSDANPKIIHVACSTANSRYAGRYIAQQIARIRPKTSPIRWRTDIRRHSSSARTRSSNAPSTWSARRIREHA